jgi:hypothetical protein
MLVKMQEKPMPYPKEVKAIRGLLKNFLATAFLRLSAWDCIS